MAADLPCRLPGLSRGPGLAPVKGAPGPQARRPASAQRSDGHAPRQRPPATRPGKRPGPRCPAGTRANRQHQAGRAAKGEEAEEQPAAAPRERRAPAAWHQWWPNAVKVDANEGGYVPRAARSSAPQRLGGRSSGFRARIVRRGEGGWVWAWGGSGVCGGKGEMGTVGVGDHPPGGGWCVVGGGGVWGGCGWWGGGEEGVFGGWEGRGEGWQGG